MKRLTIRFYFWLASLILLYLSLNFKLRIFPHILLIFWALLPLVSLVYSILLRRKLVINIDLSNRYLERGTKGELIYYLENQSKWHSIFMKLETSHKKNRSFLLYPKEKKSLQMKYSINRVGPLSIEIKQPIFEDLLGFFYLQSKEAMKSPCLYGLPKEVPYTFTLKKEKSDEEVLQLANKKSLNPSSNEVFSVEPIKPGQSLSHTHWKLSARMQEWMIKHYDDFEETSWDIKIDLNNYDLNSSDEKLRNRTKLLDLVYSLAKELFEHTQKIKVSFRRQLEKEVYNLEELGYFLADLPLRGPRENNYFFDQNKAKNILFVESFDEEKLGLLLNSLSYGTNFILFSYKENLDEKIKKRLEESKLSILWMDEIYDDEENERI